MNTPIIFSLTAVQIGGFFVASILPLLVGLVTTRVQPGGLKATLLALLTLLASIGTEMVDTWQTGASYDLGQGLITWLPMFVTAVALHYGLWKPAGISGALQDTLITSDYPTEDARYVNY